MKKETKKKIAVKKTKVPARKIAPATTTATTPTPEFIPWVKATVEDKIERCHFVINDMMKVLDKAQKEFSKLEANFFNHKHVDNVLMSQISQFGTPSIGKKGKERSEDEKWF